MRVGMEHVQSSLYYIILVYDTTIRKIYTNCGETIMVIIICWARGQQLFKL